MHTSRLSPFRSLYFLFCLSVAFSLPRSLSIWEQRSSAGATSIPTPRKEDDHQDACDGTNCQPGAGPQGEMHTARQVFLISAPPLLRRISLIPLVCSATTFFTSEMRSRASQGSGAGRDNSTHKEQHDGLSLLPAELLVYWRRSTYQSLKEKHSCGKAETTRTALPQFLVVPAFAGPNHTQAAEVAEPLPLPRPCPLPYES